MTPAYEEADLLPLSALQHLLFCERQCALIHLEGAWAENRYTAEGRHLHEVADSAVGESRAGVRTARGLALQSLRLGLSGRADVVELHPASTGPATPGVAPGAVLPGLPGRWWPFPVEYKRGKPKSGPADEVQLCAQALCLEEMLDVEVPEGALFYGKTRRRHEVRFTTELRRLTEQTAAQLHALFERRVTPAPVNDARCRRCSLVDLCLPSAPARSAARYLRTAIARSRAEPGEEEPS
jgi:CRISPR-associated exonuclease Cas4